MKRGIDIYYKKYESRNIETLMIVILTIYNKNWKYFSVTHCKFPKIHLVPSLV